MEEEEEEEEAAEEAEEGVKYSTAWSDPARLRRVMKQLRRSATYAPISPPNEGTSRAQVKNEPAPAAPLRGWGGWGPFPCKAAPVPAYNSSPPTPQTLISVLDD